MGADS